MIDMNKWETNYEMHLNIWYFAIKETYECTRYCYYYGHFEFAPHYPLNLTCLNFQHRPVGNQHHNYCPRCYHWNAYGKNIYKEMLITPFKNIHHTHGLTLTIDDHCSYCQYDLLADYCLPWVFDLLSPSILDISSSPFSIFPIYVRIHSIALPRSWDCPMTSWPRRPLSFS